MMGLLLLMLMIILVAAIGVVNDINGAMDIIITNVNIIHWHFYYGATMILPVASFFVLLMF